MKSVELETIAFYTPDTVSIFLRKRDFQPLFLVGSYLILESV